MAGRNQVTADLRISANAELQNSRAFINKLDKIIDGFDFGDKMNKQLLSAQDQLKNLNKILEKVQNKSVISDNELKELVKAGKEISNIVNKTEKLYSNFNDSDWKRYSKEYIAQVEKQQKEIAKIKEKYSKETGGNFDKDLANLDKYKQKVNDLSKEIKALNTSKDSRIQDRIDEENKALQEQFEILQKVKRVEEERKTKRQNAIDNYNQNNIAIASSDGKVKVTKESTRRDMANNEYQKMVTTFTEVSKKRQEILDSGKSEKQIQKELVVLAKQYGIQSVKNTEQFDKQLKVLQEQKNFYKLLKNRDQLVTEQAVTEEYEKRLRLAQELENIDKKVYSDNGINSERDLKIQKRKAEGTLDSSRVEVTGTGANLTKQAEDDIANEIVSATTEQTNKLTQEMTDTRTIIEQISQYTAKLATQSERDEQKNETKAILDATEDVSGKVNDYTTDDNDRIANNIIKLGINSSIPYGKEFIETARNVTAVEDKDWQQLDIDTLSYEKLSSSLENEIEDIKAGVGSVSAARELINEISKLFESIEDKTEKGFSKLIEEAEQEFKNGEISKDDYEERIENIGHRQGLFRQQTQVMANRIDTQQQVLNPGHTVDPEILGEIGEKAEEGAKNLEKAAEQSQFLGSTFDDLKGKVGYFLSLNYLFDQMTRKIGEAVAKTKEMDKDMTQIGLVLGKTSGQVWRNFDTYSKMADRLNTTTSEVTNSMKLFYQQGLNTSEVNKMVEASAIAAALGESSMAEASETLTSIINSYNLSANDAMMVTDKISQIAIVSAADFGELSTAIEKVASSAASAGLDLDHMMGYLAKMIETTREAPTNIGTALKTIVANFTQFKEDPSGLTEEGSEINKVDTALKSVGISLTDTTGEVRDLSDVLDELGGKWANLTRSQKSYLATQIAGTRQQSRFYALMNDYERTLELVAEGSNSAEKAQQQFALYSNSLEASANRLTNEWQKFFNSITQGNGAISRITNTFTNLMKIVNRIGPIGTVLGLASLIKSAKTALNTFENLNNIIEKRANRKNEYKNAKLENEEDYKEGKINEIEKTNKNKRLRNTFGKEQREEIKKLTKAEKSYITQINKTNSAQKKLNEQFKDSSTITDKFRYTIGTTKNNLNKFWASVKLGVTQVKSALTSLATQFAALIAVTLALKAISAIMSGIKSALNINTEAYIENAEKAKENADNIDSLIVEYEALSKKINKTAEEQERLKEVTEEVTKIDAKLGKQLTENANNYQMNIKAMREYSNLQKKIASQETVKAIKGEASVLNNLFMLLDGNTWTNFFGSDSDKQILINEQQTNYRELTSARTQENNLTEAQTSMLQQYAETLIEKGEENNWGALNYKYSTNDFDSAIVKFIEDIKGLDTAQQQSYTNFLKNLNDSSFKWVDLSKQIWELDLPDEIKLSLSKQMRSIIESAQAQIKANNFIKDEDRDRVLYTALGTLSVKDFQNLLTPDTSTMSQDDKINYNRDVAKLLGDTNLLQEYAKAQEKGSTAVKDFALKLGKTGQYSDVFINSIYSMTLNADAAAESLSKLGTIGDLQIEDIQKGTTSQYDILSLLAKKVIDITDVIVTSAGRISVSMSKLIAEDENRLKDFFDYWETSIEERRTEVKGISNGDNNNNLKNTKQRLDELKGAQELKKYYDGGKTGNNLDTYYNTQYENGYTANRKVNILGTTMDYSNPERVTYEKLIELNQPDKLGANPEILKVARSGYAQQRISKDSLGIKDTSTMTTEQKTEYIKQQNALLEEQKNRIKDIEKDSQDYYDTTYKIYTIQEDLKNVISEDKTLIEDNKKTEEQLNKEISETEKSYKKQEKQAENLKQELLSQLDVEERIKNKVKEKAKENLYYKKGYLAVFDAMTEVNTALAPIDAISQAFQQAGDSATDAGQMFELAITNPTLMPAMEKTATGLQWNKQKLEELARASLDEAETSIDAQITKTKSVIALLETESENIDEWSDNAVTQTAAVLGGNNALVDTQQKNAQNEATNLGISEQSWITWSDGVCKAIAAAGEEYNKFLDSEANKSKAEYKNGYNASVTVGSGGGGKGGEKSIDDKKDDIAETLKASKKSGNRTGAIARLREQITLLEGLKNDIKYKRDNLGSYLGGKLYGDKNSGSKDKFDPLIEKLEHFYNYLRKIEKLEAKINRLREERNLIDTSKNYYINNLIEENKLLAEQQDLYSNYIRDEGEYLAELRGELTKKFSKWVTFDKEGVVQVKQTEFKLNTEKQKEEYEAFSELLGLYQDEYNTREENITKLTEAQVQQVENIAAAYEKVLERVTDINEAIQKQIDLLNHDITMSFSNIAKFDIFDTQMDKAVKGIREMFGFVSEYQTQIDKINKQVSSGPFKELFRWDEDLGFYRSNDKLLEDSNTQKKYEKMGYNWAQIHTYVKSTAKASEQLNNSWEEANNNANSFAETLKTLLQDSIDNFTSLVSAAGDELNKIFDTFDKKMTRIDNESNLFGVVSENLEDKYLTLVTATATLKQTIELLNDKRATILDTIKEQYSEFVDEINGYAVINKQAIEESDKLSEGQKAQLLSWYEAFNAYDELIGESEDRLVDYFNQILEMENEKRDAIINLKQSIHDELIARDQEEIDNLREKYDKMSQLDNEYYNKLTDKINRARQLREDRQADANIPQTQARLAVLKTDNGGTRNSELIELQKQLNEQLQSQADRDVDRELERIQREQQEREEDRQLTISAMENVLTFKDDNNWYWQEAQRIWSEGPESVTGFLRTSNEYMNISDEQRAQLFEELDNSINTAFATLQTAAGITAGISDGIVRDKSDEEQAKLDNVNNNLGFIQTQLGQEGLAGKIDWANAENAKHLLEIQTNADGNALKITTKLQDLYTTKIGPGVDNLQNTVVTYLGKNSEIWQKLGMIDATTGTVNTSVTTGFTNLSSTITTALETLGTTLNSAWDAFKEKSLKVLDYLIKEHGLENKIEPDKNDVKLPQTPVEPTKGTPPKQTSTVKTDNSSNGGGNKTLKVGGGATAKSSAKIYSSYAGGSGSGQYYAKDPNYKVLQLRGNRALVRYHKLSSGYTGWFNKTDLTPYRKGGYVDYTGIATVHGSKNSPEAFLSAKQTKLFEVLRDSLVNASNNKNYTKEEKEANNTGYQIDNVNIEVKELADVDSVEKMTRKVKEEIYKDATGRNNMAVRRR